jgi:AraC-like DNA-binding protein
MELLRQQRLEAFHGQLLDPAHGHESVAALLRRCTLVNSAATRQAFEARYGQTPAALRKARGGKAVEPWPLRLIGTTGGNAAAP